jgi:tetratricopeptide (TPR) repeat protein
VGVFVGRGDELAALDEALRVEGAVVVRAVAGLGGIGKSTLVARYVLEHGGAFAQVVWVGADSVAALEAGLVDFAVALEPQVAAVLPVEGLVERALGWLAAHVGWLLVLDNVADPGLVRDLMPRLGSGRVVVTSRRGSGWAGIAQPVALDVLPAGAARELVALTVEAVGGAGLLVGVEQLCARLGFLPLALEQAAAFMAQNRVTAARYLGLLDEAPADVFADGAEGVADQRTLARVWAVSLDALADEPLCGEVLRVLAWLSPDGVARELLFPLADERRVVRALGRLAAYSMISLDEAGTVGVHRVVAAVARAGQERDAHRAPVLVERARRDAGRLLRAAVPDDPQDPACWPVLRVLAVQTAAYTGHATADTDTEGVSFVLDVVGSFLMDQGSLPLALGYMRRAMVADERLLGVEHPNTLASRSNLAAAYHAAGEHTRAIELFERALADFERILGPEHPNTLVSRNNLAATYKEAGDYGRAIELHERNLADLERTLGPEHPNTLASRNNLAATYKEAGDYGWAIELHERTLGAEHPDSLASRGNLPATYQEAGAYGRAIELHERNLADRERILGPEHPKTLASRNNLAEAYKGVGAYGRAIELHERTLADVERILGAEHPSTLASRNNLAEAYHGAGAYGRAIELFERTLADVERILGAQHPNTLTSRNNLAAAYHGAGEHGRAIELFERTLADVERILGAEHPKTLASRNNLAAARSAAQRIAGAP